MRRIHACVLRGLIAFLPLHTAFAADDYVFAKLVTRDAIEYPNIARVHNNDGWAYYTFNIGTDGRAHDFSILESNGLTSLNEALRESIESSVYEPARYNGVAVTEQSLVGRAVFMLEGKPGAARKPFMRNYRKIQSALQDGELDAAWLQLEELSAKTGLSLYEELYRQSLYVMYYGLTGDKDREYLHATRVLDFYAEEGDKSLLEEADYFVPFLVLVYQYEMAAMMLGHASLSAQWLEQMAPGTDLAAEMRAHSERVSARVENQEFWTRGKLLTPIYGGDRSTWTTRLLRREIELRDVSGQIEDVLLYCERGVKRLSYTVGQGWIVPASWGHCNLYVTGVSGATFVIAELVDGTLAPGG